MEFDAAGYFCKESMIPADADEFTGMEFRAALADEDIPGQNELIAVSFHAKTLTANGHAADGDGR